MLKHFESFFQLISIFVIISDVDFIKKLSYQSKPTFVKISIFFIISIGGLKRFHKMNPGKLRF